MPRAALLERMAGCDAILYERAEQKMSRRSLDIVAAEGRGVCSSIAEAIEPNRSVSNVILICFAPGARATRAGSF